MCGVYAEKLIKLAPREFEDLPKMIDAAEVLYGKYKWDQYSILVLPYALTQRNGKSHANSHINPTVIAGDKSLVSRCYCS